MARILQGELLKFLQFLVTMSNVLAGYQFQSMSNWTSRPYS